MDRTDKDLLEAHCTGDGTAFEELLRRHGGSVLGYLGRMTGDSHLAEDMFQETFRRVHQKAHTLRGDNARTWLFTIATRIAMDGFRKSRRMRCVSLDQSRDDGDDRSEPKHAVCDPSPDPAAAAYKAEQIRLVRQAVLDLPPRQRVTLVLAYYQQLPYARIGEILGCSPGSVKTQMFRALRKLAQRLPDRAGGVV